MPTKPSIVTGVVRDALGNPIPMARISFTAGPVPLQDIAGLTDKEGKFSLTAPVDGTYAIKGVKEGFRPTEVHVMVAAGLEKRVEIVLKRTERHD